MMAPPQVIISQPTPQQDNSLLTSYLTSKLMNESNAPVRSSTIEPAPVRPADVAPPRIMERVEPPTPPLRKPAEITPSKPIIKEKTTIIPLIGCMKLLAGPGILRTHLGRHGAGLQHVSWVRR